MSCFLLQHLLTSQFGSVYSICYVFRSGTVCAVLGLDLFGLSVFVSDARSCAFSIYIFLFFFSSKFVENVCKSECQCYKGSDILEIKQLLKSVIAKYLRCVVLQNVPCLIETICK